MGPLRCPPSVVFFLMRNLRGTLSVSSLATHLTLPPSIPDPSAEDTDDFLLSCPLPLTQPQVPQPLPSSSSWDVHTPPRAGGNNGSCIAVAMVLQVHEDSRCLILPNLGLICLPCPFCCLPARPRQPSGIIAGSSTMATAAQVQSLYAGHRRTARMVSGLL